MSEASVCDPSVEPDRSLAPVLQVQPGAPTAVSPEPKEQDAAGPGEAAARFRHILNNTAVVGICFALAALAGILRNVLIPRQFGISADLDAYYAAFRLPDLLFTIVAGGALATAFIPVFGDFLTGGDTEGAWRFASAVTNLVVLVVTGLAILAALEAPWLVRRVLAPGFDAAQQAETVGLMRLVLISTILFGISAVQGSVLNGFKHFLLPALAPIMYPLGVAAGAVFLAPTWGVRGLAAGAVVGAGLHLAVKVPALLHYGFRWWPVIDLKGKAIRRLGKLMLPRVLDLGVFQITMLVTTNLASRMGHGSISALEWGWGTMQLPETVIGTAFGIVAFPTMVELASRGDLPGLRGTLARSTRAVLVLTVPAACGLILFGQPLLAVLYERGAFDAGATAAVMAVLRFYALGLVGQSCLELAARAFFARQDMWTPLFVAAGAGVMNILLALALMQSLQAGGLALANSLAVTVEVIVLTIILTRRIGDIESRATLTLLGRVVLAAGVMSGAAWCLLRVGEGAGISPLPLALAGIAASGLIYLLSLAALGVLRLNSLRALPGLLGSLR